MAPHARDQVVAVVTANEPLCREHYRLVLKAPWFGQTEAGQFVQVACRDLDEDYGAELEWEWRPGKPLGAAARRLMEPSAMLRRPFSLAGRRDGRDGVELDIIHRVVGVGTQWMAELKAGDRVHLLGPLGNRFTLPPENVEAVLVGGGVGIPPMIYLAEALKGRKAVAVVGAMRGDLLPLRVIGKREAAKPLPGATAMASVAQAWDVAEFGIPTIITTDDGSLGMRGRVTEALEAYLEGKGRDVWLYTCGPELMMKRVAQIADERGLAVQIAVERAMACGMGTCQSCCIRVRKKDAARPPLAGSAWAYRLACTDGPVFPGADLLW